MFAEKKTRKPVFQSTQRKRKTRVRPYYFDRGWSLCPLGVKIQREREKEATKSTVRNQCKNAPYGTGGGKDAQLFTKKKWWKKILTIWKTREVRNLWQNRTYHWQSENTKTRGMLRSTLEGDVTRGGAQVCVLLGKTVENHSFSRGKEARTSFQQEKLGHYLRWKSMRVALVLHLRG